MDQPTYKQAILDILVTDIGHYYHAPTIRPPVQPDNPAQASPSDHSIVFAKANSSSSQPIVRVGRSHIVRPISDAALSNFAEWVQHESWEYVFNGTDSSDMVNRFNSMVALHLDMFCPTRSVKTSNIDGKISSPAVKQACRRKNREYLKNGNSEKYKRLKKIVKSKLKEATAKILNKQVENVSVKNNSWLKHIKKHYCQTW